MQLEGLDYRNYLEERTSGWWKSIEAPKPSTSSKGGRKPVAVQRRIEQRVTGRRGRK
jgi:hypothetical protein